MRAFILQCNRKQTKISTSFLSWWKNYYRKFNLDDDILNLLLCMVIFVWWWSRLLFSQILFWFTKITNYISYISYWPSVQVTWVSWWFKSLARQMFSQQLVQAKTTKQLRRFYCITGRFQEESTRKGPIMQKTFWCYVFFSCFVWLANTPQKVRQSIFLIYAHTLCQFCFVVGRYLTHILHGCHIETPVSELQLWSTKVNELSCHHIRYYHPNITTTKQNTTQT